MSNDEITAGALFPRSLLFVPANRPRMIEKALNSAADAIVVDLEDAVPQNDKASGRAELARTGAARSGPSLARVFVRVNAIDTSWFEADVQAIGALPFGGVVVPKVERPDDLSRVQARLAHYRAGAGLGPLPLIALLETPLGILKAADLAVDRPAGLAALAFGAEDYRARMGVNAADADGLLDFARGMVSTAAAAAGVPAVDTPEVQFDDLDSLRRAAERARRFGFAAKFAIHPVQIPILHQVFVPRSAEREWAEKVLQAYRDAASAGRGAAALDGRMIDAATVVLAQGLLARLHSG
jgi:citrate lyase beta subunit